MMQSHRHQSLRNTPGLSKRAWSYADFVRANPAGARTVESLLRYAGFFAPARLADRDVAIESGYALASLAAMAHDRILLGNSDDPPPLDAYPNTDDYDDIPSNFDDIAGGEPTGSTARMDAGQRRRSSQTTAFAERMRVALSVLAHVQIVAEKIAGQQGGERRRRQAITYLETLKAISRLLLLACTREMVIGGGKYVSGGARKTSPLPRRRDGTSTRTSLAWDFRSGSSAADAETPEIYTGRRSGVRLVVPPRARVLWAGSGGVAAVGGSDFVDGSCYCRRRGGSDTCDCESDLVGQSSKCGNSEGGCGFNGDTARGSSGVRLARPQRLWQKHGGSRTEDDGRDGDGDGGEEEPGVSHAWLMAGEVVNILRPLVYSHGCAVSGVRSWRPWLVSLGMDALAYACTTRAGGGSVALLLPLGGNGNRKGVRVLGNGVASIEAVPVLPYLDDAQTAELRRRKLLWFLYLMRSPAFEILTEPVGRGAAGLFDGVPLLGGLATYALNMLLYVQRHHFYTSAS